MTLTGELDLWGGARLLALLQQRAADPPVRVDLSGVTFIDSLGLRALITAISDEHVSGYANPSVIAARLLDVAGLTHLLLPDDA